MYNSTKFYYFSSIIFLFLPLKWCHPGTRFIPSTLLWTYLICAHQFFSSSIYICPNPSYVTHLSCIKLAVWPLPCHFAFLLQKVLKMLSTFSIFTASSENRFCLLQSLLQLYDVTGNSILRHQCSPYCFLWTVFISWLSHFQCNLMLVDNFHLDNFPQVLDIIYFPGFSPASPKGWLLKLFFFFFFFSASFSNILFSITCIILEGFRIISPSANRLF